MQCFLLFPLLCLFLGCAPHAKETPPLTVTQAQKKLEDKCREEFDLHIITRQTGNTFWIYLPLNEPIFDYESKKENSLGDERKTPKFSLQYADVHFKEGQFVLEYDVVALKKSPQEDYGFSSAYTDSYVKKQNNLLTAISDVFFNTKVADGEKLPEFFIMVITDIKKGIETRGTFYLEDFERYMTGDLPYDEYMKRFLADTKGGQSMIGDETGTHLDYKPTLMPDFLSKQMLNRLRFKFQRSDFAPADDYDKTVAAIAADTVRYYDFKDFTGVKLNNLRLDKKYSFDKTQLAALGNDVPAAMKRPRGKLIHIRFDNGEAHFDEEPPSTNQQSSTK